MARAAAQRDVQRFNFGSSRNLWGVQVQSGSSLHGSAMREGAKKKVLHGKLGSKQGLRRSAKKLHAEGARKRDQLNREKGSRGDFVPFRLSLAGCRDSVPAGVWGNAPTVPRSTSPKEVANKGAGSEASLPVTLRVRRRAPSGSSPRSREEPRKTGQVSPCRPARLIAILVITRPARIPPLLRPQCGRRPRSPPQRCRPDGSRHARRRSLRPPRTDPQSPCRRP